MARLPAESVPRYAGHADTISTNLSYHHSAFAAGRCGDAGGVMSLGGEREYFGRIRLSAGRLIHSILTRRDNLRCVRYQRQVSDGWAGTSRL